MGPSYPFAPLGDVLVEVVSRAGGGPDLAVAEHLVRAGQVAVVDADLSGLRYYNAFLKVPNQTKKWICVSFA